MRHPMLSVCMSVAAFASSLANAAPKDELHAAFVKFLAARSFHAEVANAKTGEALSSMDFLAPDRYRVHPAKGPMQVIVGDTIYMDLGGKLTPMPVPGMAKMVAQYRNGDFAKEIENGMSVQALPDDSVDGESTKVYAYTVTQPAKADAKAWVSTKTGLPIQVESSGSFMGHASTTRVRYSRFDDASIRVDAPN